MSIRSFYNYNPFSELKRWQKDINRNFGDQGELGPTFFKPNVNVKDCGDRLCIHAELPGVKREDLNIQLEEDRLTICGEKKWESKEENENFFTRERRYGKFQRSFIVPKGTKENDITARMENGVLEVNIPKPLEAQKKNISVQWYESEEKNMGSIEEKGELKSGENMGSTGEKGGLKSGEKLGSKGEKGGLKRGAQKLGSKGEKGGLKSGEQNLGEKGGLKSGEQNLGEKGGLKSGEQNLGEKGGLKSGEQNLGEKGGLKSGDNR